jgi:hypothetical protein
MARPDEKKVELTEYPLRDTLLDGVGISNLDTKTILFQRGAAVGLPQYTNMTQVGSIPSGGVFFVTGVRAPCRFLSFGDSEFQGVAYGGLPLYTNSTSSAQRMLDQYFNLMYGAIVTVTIAEKPMIILPWWTMGAGGGEHGTTNLQGRGTYTNGVPGSHALARFVKPIKVSTFQSFGATVEFYAVTSNSPMGQFTGAGQGGALVNYNPLNQLNAADGLKKAGLQFGGFISRDIV